PERPEDGELVARPQPGERARPRSDRVEQELQLAGRREAEAHRPRQHTSRRCEHEELSGHTGVDGAALDPQERIRTDRLDAEDAKTLATRWSHRSSPGETQRSRSGRSRWRAPPPPPRPRS